jgi:hypothetical protein
VVLNGTAQLRAVDVFGRVVKQFAPVQITALIPGQRMDVVEPVWNGLPFAGPVHLKLTVKAAGLTTSGQGEIWVVPWLLVLIVVLVLFAFGYYRRYRRRRQSGAPGGAQPAAPQQRQAAAIG